MIRYKFGDIVLLKFPFSDTHTFKKRPALVLHDFQDGDILVCRITSHLYDSEFDLTIENWNNIGLLLPSVIRIHKIATLQKGLVDQSIGKIDLNLKEKIKLKFSKLIC